MLGMVKIGEAAKRLGITTMALRDSAHRGEIKCTRNPGGVHYFREEDLEKYRQEYIQTKPSETVLRTGDVARLFGVSASTISGWVNSGYLSCTKTSGGRRQYSADEVNALISKMRGESGEKEKEI